MTQTARPDCPLPTATEKAQAGASSIADFSLILLTYG